MKQNNKDLILLLLRIVMGGGMIVGHGWGKLNRLLSGEEIRFGDPLGIGMELSFYLAVFAEVLCSALLIIGLFTRLASIPLIVTMVVVIFFVQLGNPFEKIEVPLLYLTGFIVILALGPGRFSLDAYRKRLW